MSNGLINRVRLGDQLFKVTSEPSYRRIEYMGFFNEYFKSMADQTGFSASALKGEISFTGKSKASSDALCFLMYFSKSSPTIGSDLFTESPLVVAINRLSGVVHHERTSYFI